MRREDIRWISASHKVNEKHISFENHKTWCLTELVAEKAVIPRRRRRKYNGDDEDEPAEASAVYIAKQTGGPKTASEAVIRVRMQYAIMDLDRRDDYY